MPNPLTGRAVKVPTHPSDAEFFVNSLLASIATVQARCPRALHGVDIGIEEVPGAILAGQRYQEDAVPLAMAVDAEPGRPARVVLFRRPLQRRAADRGELRELVHSTLVEQLSALTAIPISEIDPDVAEDL